MIKVDGQVVLKNVIVSHENRIQIGAKTGVYTPVRENTRLWLFHKPK